MGNYVGHIAVADGKITIDLGGKLLCDGVYSIIQEAKTRSAKKKCLINPTYKKYDKEAFIKQVINAIDGRRISINALADEMGIAQTTLQGRVERLKIRHLFTRKGENKEAAE